ncbi:hypothetical protein HMPREF1563_2197 [Providencia alcalifaciens 205/92]|uniref:Uncharacterized protein n=1 Tax=Providencia alcalifaciens 205/92 TaxID=1256988 RepID=A0AAV3M4G7_9GAMM|nr:hypothetical protein HMPREF1563_2197 [Providencia alcalifaciens 205/92]
MHNLCSDRLKNYFVDYYDYPSRKKYAIYSSTNECECKKAFFLRN